MVCVQRKLPSPGFQVEVVLADYNGPVRAAANSETVAKKPDETSGSAPASVGQGLDASKESKDSGNNDKDDVFSDNESEEAGSKSKKAPAASAAGGTVSAAPRSETKTESDQVANLACATKDVSLGNAVSQPTHAAGETKGGAVAGPTSGLDTSNRESEFKAMAADASVFSFGDEDDYESD